MFSGIIEAYSAIIAVDLTTSGGVIQLNPGFRSECYLGQSIAVQGVCLTVADMNDESLSFHLSSETLRCTSERYWQPGFKVNLERSITPATRMDGHYVSGHVDGTAQVMAIKPSDQCHEVTFKILNQDALAYLCPKGSIAIDGISLTINQVQGDTCTVMIIPHTWQHTSAQAWQVGQMVHVEYDMLAKMVSRQVKLALKQRD